MTPHDLSLFFFDKLSCGCGRPEDVAELLLKVLSIVEAKCETPEDAKLKYERLERELPGLFYYTVLNFYDRAGLLEHGGGLPGWLSGLGQDVLAGLKEHGTDPEEWGQHVSASPNGHCGCGKKVPKC